MPTWEPDPTAPAGQLPVISKAFDGALRGRPAA